MSLRRIFKAYHNIYKVFVIKNNHNYIDDTTNKSDDNFDIINNDVDDHNCHSNKCNENKDVSNDNRIGDDDVSVKGNDDNIISSEYNALLNLEKNRACL